MSLMVHCEGCGGSTLQAIAERTLSSQWLTLSHMSSDGAVSHFCSVQCVAIFTSLAADRPKGGAR